MNARQFLRLCRDSGLVKPAGALEAITADVIFTQCKLPGDRSITFKVGKSLFGKPAGQGTSCPRSEQPFIAVQRLSWNYQEGCEFTDLRTWPLEPDDCMTVQTELMPEHFALKPTSAGLTVSFIESVT